MLYLAAMSLGHATLPSKQADQSPAPGHGTVTNQGSKLWNMYTMNLVLQATPLPEQRPVTRVNPDSNPGGVMDMEPCYYCMIYAPGTPGFPHIWLHQLGQPWISLWSHADATLILPSGSPRKPPGNHPPRGPWGTPWAPGSTRGSEPTAKSRASDVMVDLH